MWRIEIRRQLWWRKRPDQDLPLFLRKPLPDLLLLLRLRKLLAHKRVCKFDGNFHDIIREAAARLGWWFERPRGPILWSDRREKREERRETTTFAKKAAELGGRFEVEEDTFKIQLCPLLHHSSRKLERRRVRLGYCAIEATSTHNIKALSCVR